jgi:general nucleoside transport system ATP-binding protein
VITPLSLAGISKQFGPTIALRDVSFAATHGQVHALLGENGAGKSTLMHIAYGLLRPDSGTVNGQNGFDSPRTARAAGVGMVHQHFTSIPALTVAENIALTAGWPETGRAAAARAEAVVQRLGLFLPVALYVEGLSVQLRQRLEIVKALAADACILLLDEPTAVLAPREVDELLRFIREFAAGGGAVVLITHKLDEAFRAADRVTVLRRGEVTMSERLETQTPHTLSRAMIGTDLSRVDRKPARRGDVVIRAENLVVPGSPPSGNSFHVHAGEIVGVAAIDGNGQHQLLRAIAGVDAVRVLSGTLNVAGPVAFIPEDRTTEGMIGSFTLAENLLLGTPPQVARWINWRTIGDRTDALLEANDVRAAGSGARAESLSGGNQQKFILARALEGNPRVVVAENPTRGLDVLAAQAVHERLRDAARRGAAIIVHSSDLDEVLELADRLLVMAHGEVRELPANTPRAGVGDAMLGVAQTR